MPYTDSTLAAQAASLYQPINISQGDRVTSSQSNYLKLSSRQSDSEGSDPRGRANKCCHVSWKVRILMICIILKLMMFVIAYYKGPELMQMLKLYY